MDLLRENPKSALWLMKLNEDAQKNLAKTADYFEVDPKRLVFATRVPRIEDHLARYRLADICLDTFPYNGHTTTSDALLSNVPVVTVAGSGFASRVAASLIHDVGHDDWKCSDFQSYKSKANSIANASLEQQHNEKETHGRIWPNDEIKQGTAFSELMLSL